MCLGRHYGHHEFMNEFVRECGYDLPKPRLIAEDLARLFERFNRLEFELQETAGAIKRAVALANVGEAEFAAAAEAVAKNPASVRREYMVIRAELFAVLAERDGLHCKHCLATEHLSIDHIIPVIRGGTNELENLQILCRTCNSTKGSKVVSIRRVES